MRGQRLFHQFIKMLTQLTTKLSWLLLEKRWLTGFLMLAVLCLGVITRLMPPTTPDKGLVFDESYFVPQAESYAVNRYYFDPHPPLGKFFLYAGIMAVNPDAAEKIDPDKLGNLVNNYKTPLDLNGIRLAPRIFGSLVPVIVFVLVLQFCMWGRAKITNTNQFISINLIAFLAGCMAALDNSLVVESRYALLTQLMLFWMLLSLMFAALYYNATRYDRSEIYFILASFSTGAAVSVKWLALSVVPIVVLIVLFKEWNLIKPRLNKWKPFISTLFQRGLFLALAMGVVYLSVFAWHFEQIKHHSPAANELSEAYQQELKTGEKTVGFMYKVNEWHYFARNYAKGVPALDYTKKDEIGSMWVTWPIMARPINYYWQTDGDGLYGIVYLIGNPLVWALSLLGVLCLSAMGLSRLLGKNNFKTSHLLLILFYFANWLPFALIERVMYLYHYIPAMVVGLLMLAVFIHDFVLPRLRELYNLGGVWKLVCHPNLKVIVYCLLLISVLGVFLFYAPFTYAKDVSKAEWSQRVLLKEWNMKWPGGDN
jgi:dolichyl-phosphate-mannose-protein mannosyltransferase